jgi:hypothetical protein
MITFAKYHPPHGDPRNLRTFVARCRDIVWCCLEQWGGETVRDWYWCIWNEPNNIPVGGGLSFEQYREIYKEAAGAIYDLLKPHLQGHRSRIGGPAVDGFQPYWMDWISGLVRDVDESLVGFVSWHAYGDWRPVVPAATLGFDLLGSPEAPNGAPYRALLMAQTPKYEARARSVARLLAGRDIMNVCGELNTVVHHNHQFVGGLNQSAFGAAYYASALIHLLRGGADLEMRWTGTDNDDAYGLISPSGKASAACLAKQLFAQHVRFGDWVRFFEFDPEQPDIDAVMAWNDDGRLGGVFVHTADTRCVVNVSDRGDGLSACDDVLKIDAATGRRIVREPFDGTIRFDGCGVAVVTNAAAAAELD